MQHALLIIGDDLRLNLALLNHIFARYTDHFGEPAATSFLPGSDKELPFLIASAAKTYPLITIVASEAHFHTTAKILATLTNDNIELKEATLMPSNAKVFEPNSFVVESSGAKINLILASVALPNLLLTPPAKPLFFTIIGENAEGAKALLDPLATTFNVSLTLSSLLSTLTLVRAYAGAFGEIEPFLAAAKTLFSNRLATGRDIVDYTAKQLIKKELKITFAESCTGGLLAKRFTDFAGVSGCFEGSVVTYSNRLKNRWISVPEDILNSYGAVSEQTAARMANGALKLTKASFALATTGVAGPGGGSEAKPVGTVFIAVASASGVFSEKLSLKGDREYIREQTLLSAFALLLRHNPILFDEG